MVTGFKKGSGQSRVRFLRVRISDHEHKRLVERAKKSGAVTPSAYVRAAVLTGREFEMPSWDELRGLRNDVIKLTGLIETAPSTSARDRALEAAINALDRITRF